MGSLLMAPGAAVGYAGSRGKQLRLGKPSRILAGLGVFVLMLGGFVVHSYRGLALVSWRLARNATWGETRSYLETLSGFFRLTSRLVRDPATGTYHVPAPAAGRDLFRAGQLAYHRGQMSRAVELFEAAIDRHGESEHRLLWLGLAHLRRAEAARCSAGLPGGGERAYSGLLPCSLPLPPSATLDREDGPAAAASFTRILQHYDPGERRVRWLLDYTALLLGELPRPVAEGDRIETPITDAFYGDGRQRARERFPHLRFAERARELGVATDDAGRGVAVEDLDGDGWLDLVVAGGFETLRYYRNRAGRGFEDVTDASDLGDVRQPFIVSAADYDGDGWMDLLVSRLFQPALLLHNEGGRFHDATVESGLRATVGPGRTASTWVSTWGDVDGDADLDLFLARWALRLPLARGFLAIPRASSALLINDNGVFRDRTAEYGLAGLVRDLYFAGASFGDYDLDGRPDLVLSSPLWATSVLLHNRDGQRFEPVDPGELVPPGFTVAFVDADQDGRLDLFQGGSAVADTSIEMTVFGEHLDRYRSGWSAIYLQGPDRHFHRRTDLFEDPMPLGTMGASFGDLDNDGCLDVYLGTGGPEAWFIVPNLLYVGERDGRRCAGRMANVSMLEGFGTVHKGHGIVFFDFDRDGDEDVYSALGGMWPGERSPNRLLVNESRLEGRRWVDVRLRGRRRNRFGVGARIRVRAVDPHGGEIVRWAEISNGTGFGSSPYLAHVGLLDAVAIRDIQVDWPSGCRSSYPGRLDSVQVLPEPDGCGS